jgi:hypothetical protein
MLECEGVEATDVAALSSRLAVCKKRPGSGKGSGGGEGVEGAGEPTCRDLGVVVGSRDSKRVMSLDTAIIRLELNKGGRFPVPGDGFRELV